MCCPCAYLGARRSINLLTVQRRAGNEFALHRPTCLQQALQTHRLVEKLIEVLVMAEDNVATHVKQEAFWRTVRARQAAGVVRLQVVTQAVSFLLAIMCLRAARLVKQGPIAMIALVKARSNAQAGWTCTHDQDANLETKLLSAHFTRNMEIFACLARHCHSSESVCRNAS